MRKKLFLFFSVLLSVSLFVGCSSKPVTDGTDEAGKDAVKKYPAGAIFPVYIDEEKEIKSNTIEFSDFSLTLPEGLVYGKAEYDGCTGYYVWRDKEDKDYTLELDSDILLYVYEGLDSSSLHEQITDNQAYQSLKGSYIERLRVLVDGRFSIDALTSLSDDEKYHSLCFVGNSGDYISTTYSVMCFPKTYYGLYFLQNETKTYDRKWYGFTFSNDGEGEIFSKSEYEYLINFIKSQFNESTFYALKLLNYDPNTDVAKGRTYDQMLSLFDNTYLYYVNTLGKPYERNIEEETTPDIVEEQIDSSSSISDSSAND